MAAAERIIVLGLDGAVPWQFRDRAAAGELPNIAQIIEKGHAGPGAATAPGPYASQLVVGGHGLLPRDH